MLLWRETLTCSWRLQETLPNGSWHCMVTAAAMPDPVARNSFILLPFQDARSPTQQPAGVPLAEDAPPFKHRLVLIWKLSQQQAILGKQAVAIGSCGDSTGS